MDRAKDSVTPAQGRPFGRRLVRSVLSVGLLLAIAAGASLLITTVIGLHSLLTRDSWYDNHQFDKLEAKFDADPGIFNGPVAYMDTLVATHPDAESIGWYSHSLCITMPGEDMVCDDPSDDDREAFEPLPNANGIVYYSRDANRYFISFNHDDPPEIYAMYAPDDAHPADFAKSRGFRRFRAIDEDWSLLGYIPDSEKSDAQWRD